MKRDSSKYISRRRFSAKKLSGKHKDPSKSRSSGGSSIKKEEPVINSLESSKNAIIKPIQSSESSESSESSHSSLFEIKKKSSKPDFKGIGMFLNVYGEASISMEKQLEDYKNDLRKLQKEFDNQSDKRKRELIKLEINTIMENIKKVKTQMKKLFNGANTITSKAIDILNSGDSERRKKERKERKEKKEKKENPDQKYFKDTEVYKKLFKDNLKSNF